MTTELPYEPALVHVTGISDEAAAGLRAPRARRRYHVIPRTVVLTSDEPVKQLLKPDPNREWAILIARTNDIVLTESKGDGQAAANTSDATLANPNGATIPHDTTIKLHSTTSELWGATPTTPTRVTVITCYCED